MSTVQHANFIEYGRRGPRPQKSGREYAEDLFGQGGGKAPHRGVKILPRSEYQRINASLNAKETKKARDDKRNQEKQRLKDLSRQKISTWGNTLQGQRKAKLEAKAKRDEQDDERRKVEDIHEAIYQAEQRRHAIERAKTITFAHTDRVKDFHGALILTEVLKERDAQIVLQQQREEAARIKEEKRNKESNKRLAELAEIEYNAAAARLKERKEVQKYRFGQVKQIQEKAAVEVVADKLEGIKLARIAKEHEEMEKQVIENIEKQKIKMRKSIQDHLQASKILREKEVDMEKKEDAKIKIFTEYKQQLNNLRKQRVNQHMENNIQLRLKLVDRLEQQFAHVEGEHEKTFQKRKKELEVYEDAVNEARAEKLNREKKEVVAHRKMQVNLNIEARERQIEQERIEGRQKMDDDKDWENHLIEKEKKRRGIAVEFKNNHLKRINRKAATERNESELNFACDQTINQLNKLEEEQFQQYAKEVIDEAVKKERNPYPLRKAAIGGKGSGRGPKFSGIGGLRPSYLACDQSGVQMPNYAQRKSTMETKARIGRQQLGFVWPDNK